MRTIWNGVIHFGASQIPVGLAPARENGDLEFRTLHRGCLQPIRQHRACPDHGKLAAGDTVKGWELAPGEFLPIEDVDLEAATPLASTRQIQLLGTLPVADLDPLAIDRPYFLAPSSARVGHQPYTAFAEAVHAAGAVVICRFHAWGREQLAAIRAHGDGRALIIQTLVWAEDIRAHDIDQTLAAIKTTAAEKKAAAATLAKLRTARPAKLKSTHRQAVRELLEKRLAAAKRRPRARKPRAAAGSAARA